MCPHSQDETLESALHRAQSPGSSKTFFELLHPEEVIMHTIQIDTKGSCLLLNVIIAYMQT